MYHLYIFYIFVPFCVLRVMLLYKYMCIKNTIHKGRGQYMMLVISG